MGFFFGLPKTTLMFFVSSKTETPVRVSGARSFSTVLSNNLLVDEVRYLYNVLSIQMRHPNFPLNWPENEKFASKSFIVTNMMVC